MEDKKLKFDFTNEDMEQLIDYCIPSVLKTFEDRKIISGIENDDFQIGIDFTQRGVISYFLVVRDVKVLIHLLFRFHKRSGKCDFTLWWDDEEVIFDITDDSIIQLIMGNQECLRD